MNETEITDTEDRQKWLRDEIPWDWEDKVTLIPRLLFKCLIDFVEEENGLKSYDTDWTSDIEKGYVTQEYVNKQNAIYAELHNAYEYVKHERPQLVIDFDNSYPELIIPSEEVFESTITTDVGLMSVMKTSQEMYGKSFKDAYAENNRLEELIESRDQWVMHIIIKHVGYLWT